MRASGPKKLLHQGFSEQVERTPQGVALIQGDREVTFQELGERVDRLTRGLAGEGIGAGSTVGLFMERSVEWVARSWPS
jgi:non-ribosomal peptide synthetase component F